MNNKPRWLVVIIVGVDRGMTSQSGSSSLSWVWTGENRCTTSLGGSSSLSWVCAGGGKVVVGGEVVVSGVMWWWLSVAVMVTWQDGGVMVAIWLS